MQKLLIVLLLLFIPHLFYSQSKKTLYKSSLFVTDKDRKIVTNFEQESLKLTVNGKEISTFELVREIAPLQYVLAIDTSTSMRGHLEQIIDLAKAIIDQNNENDLALSMHFSDTERIRFSKNFTSDKSELNRRMNDIYLEGGRTALVDALYKSVQVLLVQRDLRYRYRQVVLVISDGQERSSYYKESQLFDLLEKENIQVVFIGLTEDLDTRGTSISTSPKERAERLIEDVVQKSGGLALFPNSASIMNFADILLPVLREQYFIIVELPTEFVEPDFKIVPSKPLEQNGYKFFTKFYKKT